jgi:hypothetical protein
MVDFMLFHNKGNIDDKLGQKDVVHAQLKQIEQSQAWQQHSQQHKDAKLEFVATTKTDEELLDEKNLAKISSEVKNHFTEMQHGDVSPSYKQSNNPAGETMFAGCPCGAIFLARFFGDSMLEGTGVKQYSKSDSNNVEQASYSGPKAPQPGYDSGNYAKKY